MKFLLSIVICQLLIVFFALTLAPPVHAQAPCPDAIYSRQTINKINIESIKTGNFDDKPFVKNQFNGLLDAVLQSLSGCSQLNPEMDRITMGQGALAASGTLLASLYSAPPASGVQYFAQMIQKLNPVQPAYAQKGTIGYDILEPVLNLWRQFRNASYVGFIIVFVIVGFMIMFRAHISPQAVATIQDSLPRIVIALILVTFSFAIAGLMIDLMFLILNIAINILDLSGRADTIFNQSVIGVIWGGWNEIFGTVYESIDRIIKTVVDIPALGKLIGIFGGAIAGIIIAIAVLFIMFKIFFMLLMAYAMIIILTIFAPFFFLFQALPGQNGAGAWFRQMAAQVSVFAIVGIMILLAGKIAGITAFGGSGVPIDPSSEQVRKLPLLTGGIPTDAITGLIAIGFLLMTPEAANLAKNIMGAKGPGFGGAGMSTVGAAAGVVYTGSTARGVAGAMQAGGRTAQAEAGERLMQRVPFVGALIKQRRDRFGTGRNP